MNDTNKSFASNDTNKLFVIDFYEKVDKVKKAIDIIVHWYILYRKYNFSHAIHINILNNLNSKLTTFIPLYMKSKQIHEGLYDIRLIFEDIRKILFELKEDLLVYESLINNKDYYDYFHNLLQYQCTSHIIYNNIYEYYKYFFMHIFL